MHIVRVQIEEGFLHGLDVRLSSGLNVLIGARGTGKTSLIELIRFCLGVQGNTLETSRRSRDHALSVLGSGQITVTLSNGSSEVLVTRAASDPAPRSAAPYDLPAIFSQTEIETVGLQATGRLMLVDSFLGSDSAHLSTEKLSKAEFVSVSVEIEKLRREIDELERQLSVRPAVLQQITEGIAEQNAISNKSDEVAKKSELLSQLGAAISSKAVLAETGKRSLDAVAIWYQSLEQAVKAVPMMDAGNANAPSLKFMGDIEAANSMLKGALGAIASAYHAYKNSVDLEANEKVRLESSARQVRQEVDAILEGSGLILRKMQQLQEQKARLDALADHFNKRNLALKALLARRVEALDKLDAVRQWRFDERSAIVRNLNKILEPRIRVVLTRNAQSAAFASAIAEALKGSGLRFSDISEEIAKNLSPRALVEAVDTFDQELIAEVAGISLDRAARALSHLRSADLGRLGTTDVEDDASFQLLDGADFKDFAELSTGQRCTVVLPMVLAHQNKVIIVDQPEDHIDNAFIAETLIRVLVGRGQSTQIIFSTHNPNIPVLGNAQFVLQLGSDGRRGFPLAQGSLNDRIVVQAISNVMEGGAAAFSTRSQFYSQLV